MTILLPKAWHPDFYWPCNCGHIKKDHYKPVMTTDVVTGETTEDLNWVVMQWCKISEQGKCPCDQYTEMNNFEYIQWRTK